jgi:hypothetical protein
LAVEESASVSPEEVYCTFVVFDEPINITGSGEGGLALEAIPIKDLRILTIKGDSI